MLMLQVFIDGDALQIKPLIHSFSQKMFIEYLLYAIHVTEQW